jgi:hypothetical protein
MKSCNLLRLRLMILNLFLYDFAMVCSFLAFIEAKFIDDIIRLNCFNYILFIFQILHKQF